MTPLFGEQDFVQYWTAFALFVDGANPYDVAATKAMQCVLGHDCDHVLVSWNPPWLLVLLAPVLWLPFAVAAKVWVVAGIGMGVAAAMLIADCGDRGPRTLLYALVGMSINVPLLLSLGFGQTGALLLFAAALLLHGRVKTGSVPQQAVALVILSIKPHLFFLVGAALLWDELRLRRVALIGQVAAILAVMVLILAVVNPIVVSAWLDHFTGETQGDGVVALTEWNTPTVGNFVRIALRDVLGHRADMFLVVVPLVSLFALLWWCWRYPNPNWLRIAPPLFTLSIWLAPYGWAYDWAVLGILQAVLLTRLANDGQLALLWLATGIIVAMQLGAGYLTFGLKLPLESLVWLPAAEIALWYGVDRISLAVRNAAARG